MAAASRQRDWWHKYDDLLPRQFSVYLGFEGDACVDRTDYETMLIPGLLQTADCARALFEAAQPGESEEELQRRIEARLLRQAVITGANGPRLYAIVDEAALHRLVGGPEVMGKQLEHLLEVGRRGNVTVQVIPFRAGAYMSMEGGFIILRFAEATDPEVVCIDTLTRSLYIDDASEGASLYRCLRAPARDGGKPRRLSTADRGSCGGAEKNMTGSFDPTSARWFKSTRSNGGSGNCTEVADLGTHVGMRGLEGPWRPNPALHP